ncbi:sugar transporter [Prochlorothrix hollandica PCC 9006 = CALU 1027]|uniref:Sugar transporter n=1 Tax=Prochlorothrix hollandica PCC 9006 = CALU 1027 TaxID=317619 RepID=A0A0M2Q0L7_PROHO|nr:sugar transporter [Prochlorothrix hollandica PCC 9006 = CALU 1027]
MPSSLPDPADRSPQSPLGFATKLAFGAGDLGTAITANLQVFFLMYFLTSVAGLNPTLAGSVLLVGKMWDAINDPIVGILSDRTRSPWGRRYPWMLWGSLPFGLSFFLLWLVPFQGDWALFAYYSLVAIVFNTAYTTVNLPYTALTTELTQDYDERTSLNSFRFFFSIGGSIFSLILAQIIFAQVQDQALRYVILGGVCAVLSVLPIYWCVWGTKGRTLAIGAPGHPASTSAEVSLPIGQQLRIAFSNRPFLFVIGIYLCSWLGVQITATVIPYFVIYWMGMPEAQMTPVLLGVQGTALIMLFVWSAVSQRVGKKATYFMGMGLWIVAQGGLFFLQPDQVTELYILAVMAGVGVSTAYLIPWSMVPDVIDLDELQTGQRREGIFYGFMVLLQKLGLAAGLFLVGKALDGAGFLTTTAGEAIPQQPDSALMAIRVAIGPVPTLFLILGLVLAYYYPITREVHGEIMLKLRERKENAP